MIANARWLGSTRSVAAMCAALVTLAAIPASAHEAPETSATVTLREETAEVWIDVDTLAWLGAILDAPAAEALLDPTQLTPDAIRAVLDAAGRSAGAVRLSVDGARVPLELVQPLGVEQVLAAAAARLEGGHTRTRLALRGVPASPLGPHVRVALRLPPGFGPTIMNLVRPATQWVRAGREGDLAIGEEPPAGRIAATPAPWELVVAALTGLLLGMLVARSRRPPSLAPALAALVVLALMGCTAERAAPAPNDTGSSLPDSGPLRFSLSRGAASAGTSCAGTAACTNPGVGPVRDARCGVVTADDGTTWTVPAPVSDGPHAVDIYDTCRGTGANPGYEASLTTTVIDPSGSVITAQLFADNDFELYVNGTYVARDSVGYTPFNSAAVRFQASYPITYAVRLTDWEELLGVGLESMGGATHIGDGGFIATFSDGHATHASWRCRALYVAPLDSTACLAVDGAGNLDSSGCPSTDATVRCVATDPSSSCLAAHVAEPDGWTRPDFDDSRWLPATIYPASAVTNQPAYVDYASTLFSGAEFIWSRNLDLDNHVLCRVTVTGPA